MLKPLLISLLLIVVLQNAWAQKQADRDTLIYYFNNSGQATAKNSADFSLLILPNRGANTLYPVLEFYANGKPKLITTSSVQSLNLVLQGVGKGYYPNGKPSRISNYKDGKLEGKLTDYYPNSNKSKVMNYKNGIAIDTVVDYYPNGQIFTKTMYDKKGILKYISCRDSDGVVLADNGNGKWIEFNDDLKTGARQAILKEGRLVGQWQPMIDTAKYEVYNKTEPAIENAVIKPVYKFGTSNFNTFLQNNVVYPKKDKTNSPQKVSVTMVVEKDGTLTHIRSLKSPSITLSEETIRLIGLSSPWVPGSAVVGGPPLRTKIQVNLIYEASSYSIDNKFVNVYIVNDNDYLLRNNNVTVRHKLSDIEYNKTGEIILAANADKEARFPGGQEAFFRFLSYNINYPAIDRLNKVSGRVFASFIVEKDGMTSNIKALRGPSETLKNEAVRIISQSPKWIPGVKNDTTARIFYTVPITFSFDGEPHVALFQNISDSTNNTQNKTDTSVIFLKVDKQPEFPGGLESFGHFLGDHIKYPEKDRDKGISGKVILQFIVEKDGSLSDLLVVRGPSDSMNEEAIRVMKLSPRWLPGMQGGRPVRVQFSLPINFTVGEMN